MSKYKSYRVIYKVGKMYKLKYVAAETKSEAIKKANVKNIIDVVSVFI